MSNTKSIRGLCLTTLDSLVSELLKDRPDEKRVREWMAQVGLTYSADPVERMNAVLEALDGHQKRKTRRDHERSV